MCVLFCFVVCYFLLVCIGVVVCLFCSMSFLLFCLFVLGCMLCFMLVVFVLCLWFLGVFSRPSIFSLCYVICLSGVHVCYFHVCMHLF